MKSSTFILLGGLIVGIAIAALFDQIGGSDISNSLPTVTHSASSSFSWWWIVTIMILGSVFYAYRTERGKSLFTQLVNYLAAKHSDIGERSRRKKEYSGADRSAKPTKKPESVGTYINVFVWHLVVRPALSFVCALLLSGILSLIMLWGDIYQSDWDIFWLITFAFTLYFALADETSEVVPAAHVAMITLWGKRFRIYRQEGIYSWTGKTIGIGRSTEVRSEGVTKEGFINIEPFPISIWSQSGERGKLKLKSLAKDSSEISSTLTLTIQILDPMLWINSTDPALDFSDQARTAFRTSVSYFTGVDCTAIKSIFWKMMMGQSILTVFLPENTNEYIKGSLIRSRGGTPMYEVLPDNTDERVIDKFVEKLKLESDPQLFEKCIVNGVVKAEIRSVESVFVDVLTRLGVVLTSAAIGNIDLSDVVTAEANKAASEPFQRSAQVASARATAEGVKILDDASKDVSDLVMAIIASKDYDGVKVVVTGGDSNKLKSAAATHATISNQKT